MHALTTLLYRYACGFTSHQSLVDLLTQPDQLDHVFLEHFDLSEPLLDLLYLPSLHWLDNIRLRNEVRRQLLQSDEADAFKQFVPQLQHQLVQCVESAFPAVPSSPGTLDLADGEDIDAYLSDAPQLRAKHANRVLPPWTTIHRDDLIQHPSAMAFLDLGSQHYHLPAYMRLAGQDLLNEETGMLGARCMSIFQQHQADLLAVFSPAQLRCTFDMAVVLAACENIGPSDIDAAALGQIADWLGLDVQTHAAFGGT